MPRTTRVAVLRLGHRKKRDVRVTTHCALVARAFGAEEIVLSGEKDDAPLKTIESVSKKWGGSFRARYARDAQKFLNKFKGVKLHLTMYGEALPKKISEIKRAANAKPLLIVIGASKVPREVYDACDYNVAVGSQPHSEVAALAVFLHEFFAGRELNAEFAGARIRVTPNARGKTVSKKKIKKIKTKTKNR